MSSFGLNELANITTYYFRIRASDARNNSAAWSNPASASFVSPASLIVLVSYASFNKLYSLGAFMFCRIHKK